MNLFANADVAVQSGKELTLNLDPSQLMLYGPIGLVAVLLLVSIQQFRKQEGGMKYFGVMLATSLLSLVGWAGTRVHMAKDFDSRVSEYVVAAYNAETPEEAKLQFDRALNFIKERNMTQGSTGVLYPTPNLDVGDWFSKIEKAESKLVELNENKDKLNANQPVENKVNNEQPVENKQLTPWQKTLIESKVVKKYGPDSDKVVVSVPENISVHPYGLQFSLWFYGSVLSTLLFGLGF